MTPPILDTVASAYLCLADLHAQLAATYREMAEADPARLRGRAPGEALPCHRIGDKIAVKRSKYGGSVRQFRSLRLPRR